jgi:hypothetical protein
MMTPPAGEEGLKKDEAKRIVEILSSAPIGSRRGVVVLGPMDLATIDAQDVLLKALEDHREDWVQPILWADDVGGVRPTVVSRCLSEWVDGEAEPLDDEIIHIVDAALDGDLPELLVLLHGYKGKPIEVIRQAARVIAADPSQTGLDLWGRLRSVASFKNPTPVEVAMALIG